MSIKHSTHSNTALTGTTKLGESANLEEPQSVKDVRMVLSKGSEQCVGGSEINVAMRWTRVRTKQASERLVREPGERVTNHEGVK